ncbi:MAG: tRNA pseudouridine synthase A, partial [Clostridia bacterium]|nr:tRNA pseudouridine synthase A [Clostridia bacterium]
MNIKITVGYDGTSYCGWQTQPNGVTVQETLENAVFKAFNQTVKITGSGRTDSGVHARGQVASFLLDSSIPPEKICKAVNAYLPNDIRVL